MSEALIVAEQTSALMPMSMGASFKSYRALQNEIDKAMPESIVKIQGRDFRTKSYWRAVAVAFSLSVECVKEERITQGDDWGYGVVYRASAKNGMHADGDGCCMASEKAERQRTVHNVKAHAHTRAYNRAISNLVGFGEVSAEEVEREDHAPRPVTPAPAPVATPAVASHEPPDLFPEDNTPIPAANPVAGGIYVERITKLAEGTGKRGPWILHAVKFTDGSEGSTFAKELVDLAQICLAAKIPVIPSIQPSPKGDGKYNLIGLLKAV